jgi:hypothetical protein
VRWAVCSGVSLREAASTYHNELPAFQNTRVKEALPTSHKLCHTGSTKPTNPKTFAYICTRATLSPIEHLKHRHRLGPSGPIAQEPSLPSTPSHGQSSIDGYCIAVVERNKAALAFNAGVFKGLLTRMFTEESLALSKIDAPAVRDVLTYLNPRCKAVIPSRTTLRASIAAAYDNDLIAVTLELGSASTKVNISFDLWTSLGRRLSLLGVVAHYLNDNFEPRAILLAMPRMQGSHTAVNLKGQIVGLVQHFGLENTLGYAIIDNASARYGSTRRGKHTTAGRVSAAAIDAKGGLTPVATQVNEDSTQADNFAESQIGAEYLSLEHHFTHNINAAWQKLEKYYNLSNNTPIYRATVFFHPKLKWRWFKKYWESKPEWIAAAREAVNDLWCEYKETTPAAVDKTAVVDEDDEWSLDDQTSTADQLWLYEHEPHPKEMSPKDSPIDYWISKRAIWPQLASMALDVFATPAMSDEPERVFSIVGNLLAPRRRSLKGEGVEQMLCLRSWQSSGIIKLDQASFADTVPIDEVDDHELSSSNLLYHDQI